MDNNSNFGGGNGTGSDQPAQTPAAPTIGDVGGIQTPPPAVEPTIPVSVPPIGGSDPAGIVTPPVTPAPAPENPEQSGGTGGTTTGM